MPLLSKASNVVQNVFFLYDVTGFTQKWHSIQFQFNLLVLESRVAFDSHRESVFGLAGFSLGFRSTLLRMAAVFVPWIQICTVILEHRDRAAVRVCQYEI